MRAITSRALLALTFATGLGAAPAIAATAAAPAASAASQPADMVSPAFAAAYNGAVDLLKAGNGAAGLAKVKELEALPGTRSPYEQFLQLRVRGQAEYMTDQSAAAIADFDAALASPLLPAAERPAVLNGLARALYDSKQYPRAVTALQGYLDAGGTDAQLRDLLPGAQFAAGDYANAAKGLRAQVDGMYAAGKVPTDQKLRMLAIAYSKTGDDANYKAAVERLAVAYPTPDIWRQVIANAAETKYADRLYVDNYRLKATLLGGTADGDRLSYAAQASRAGYPEEAKHILDDAYASKPFTGADLAEAGKMRVEINKAVAADRAQQASNEKAALAAKDGNSLVSQGLLETVDGNAQHGAQLIEQGIAKGGLKLPEDAKLHLGYAQVRAGREADALKTFQTVNGPNGQSAIAHVWVLYLQSRMQPAAAAAPASAASK